MSERSSLLETDPHGSGHYCRLLVGARPSGVMLTIGTFLVDRLAERTRD